MHTPLALLDPSANLTLDPLLCKPPESCCSLTPVILWVPAEVLGTGCVVGKGEHEESETGGFLVGQSRAITEPVTPQPLPEDPKPTGNAEDAEAGVCSFSWVYTIALSQGYLNVKLLCSS